MKGRGPSWVQSADRSSPPPSSCVPPAVDPQTQSAAVATQVEVPQPAANPQVPVATNPQVPPPVNPQAPRAAALEAKHDPVAPDHAASASQGASSGARPNPPVTIHRQLLLRLVRALPIASESQLQAMLNVFDPNTTPPPAAPNPNPPQNACRVPPHPPRRHTARRRPTKRSSTALATAANT